MHVWLHDRVYKVAPSLADADPLGFSLLPAGEREAWTVGSPSPGPCRIISPDISVVGAVRRFVPLNNCGFRGLSLELPREHRMHASAFQGCLVIQRNAAVGVVLGDIKRAHAFCLDVVELSKATRPLLFYKNPLVVAGLKDLPARWGYSAALRRTAALPDAGLDVEAFCGRAPFVVSCNEHGEREDLELETVPVRPVMPEDTRCMYLGGVYIHSGSVVFHVAEDAEVDADTDSIVTFMRGESADGAAAAEHSHPLFADMVALLTQFPRILIVIDQEPFCFSYLRESSVPALPTVQRLRPGCYMWGYQKEKTLVPAFLRVEDLGGPAVDLPAEPALRPKQHDALLDFDDEEPPLMDVADDELCEVFSKLPAPADDDLEVSEAAELPRPRVASADEEDNDVYMSD